jgi:hypothetical protein
MPKGRVDGDDAGEGWDGDGHVSLKSNFNREFLRVMGISPKGWLKAATQQDVGDKPPDLAR